MSTSSSKKPFQIVVGFDFSSLSERAVEEALTVSATRAPAEIHVVTVGHEYGTLACLPGETKPLKEEDAREVVRRRVAEVVARYQKAHGPVAVERIAVYVLVATPSGNLATPITDLAASVEADLVIVGTHGRTGVRRALLGSVAAEVARGSRCSVYIVNPSDFVEGEKVPEIEPPLAQGEPHLKHFEHRRTYHYVDKVSPWTHRTLPVA
jgi:nucleotide-binding universal stress UspA family protein